MKTLFLFFLFVSLIHCSGSPLVGEPDPQASEADLKTLTVSASHFATQNADGTYPDHTQTDGTKAFDNDQGITITLTRAEVSWGHLHLISEGSDEECEAGLEEELHLENIENILDDDLTSMTLVTAQIPDATFCQYHLELEGVEVAGQWSDGTQNQSFSFSISETLEVENVFYSNHGDTPTEHPLHFHEGEDSKTLTFGNQYDRWFDGVLFDESQEMQSERIKENILNNLQPVL